MGGCRDRASSSCRRRKRNALDVQCPRPREEKFCVLLVTEKGRRLNSIIARAAADDDGKEERIEESTMISSSSSSSSSGAQTGGEISSEASVVYPLAKPRIPKVASEEINSMKELTAKAIIGEVLRISWRDFLPTVALVFVAGFFAQALNLGGTFILALIQVHEV